MKNILVTGGAGYIGSHAAKALATSGYTPVVLDDLSAGHRWAVQWGPFIEGKIEDRNLVRRCIEAYRIDAVLHFAASASVRESMNHPRQYFQNNVANALAFIEAVAECGVDKFVFSSTCAVYGSPERTPMDETHRELPVNPYGESKLFIERALRWYDRAYHFRSACLRYFNAAGADPDGQTGECHSPETHIVPLVLEAAMGLRDHVTIYGNDFDTPDGTAVRDYVHVSDLADAHVSALDYLFGHRDSVVLNLGSGTGSSVREVIAAVEKVTGRRVKVRNERRHAGDPAALVAAPARAHKVLNWKPAIAGLEEIVATAWKWHSATKGTKRAMLTVSARQGF